MRIYLAAAMTHTGRDLDAIRMLLECLEADGHAVPSRHVADSLGRNVESEVTDVEAFAHTDARDVREAVRRFLVTVRNGLEARRLRR
jgi:hypothetical protein